MLKVITSIRTIADMTKVLHHLEEKGYVWKWSGVPEGMKPTKFIGWRFSFTRHRRMGQSKGIVLVLDEEEKEILHYGPFMPVIEEYCEMAFNDFLFEITQK